MFDLIKRDQRWRKATFAIMIVQLARFGSGATEIDFSLDNHLSKFR